MKHGYTTPVSPLDEPKLQWTDKWVRLPGAKAATRFRDVNRANRRAARFGGVRAKDGSVPARSRIQRGISRPGVRGTILRNGIQPIIVTPEGERMDMAEFSAQLEDNGIHDSNAV